MVSKLVYMRESDGELMGGSSDFRFNFRFGGDVKEEGCEGKEIKFREFLSLIEQKD